jgi:hypothetical protein
MRAILLDDIYWLGHPYLLYQKRSANAKPLQAGLKGVCVRAEERLNDYIVLNCDKLAGVGTRPFLTVPLKHRELFRKGVSRRHLNAPYHTPPLFSMVNLKMALVPPVQADEGRQAKITEMPRRKK